MLCSEPVSDDDRSTPNYSDRMMTPAMDNSAKKRFLKRPDEIRQLVASMGYCFATDRITVDGSPVGYMYREAPDRSGDSGWRFFAGDETDAYANDPGNVSMYSVNTIANYDPDIIEFLNQPVGSAFERKESGGPLRSVNG